jgi:hypothetical protein
MNRLQRSAVISALAEELIKKGSWCGETNLQRSMYFLQTLFECSTGFEFVMYKNAPFSFDLRDELTAMLGDCLLCMMSEDPQGPRLMPTEQSAILREHYSKTLGHFAEGIDFVAEKLAKLDVSYLERSATALYVERLEQGNRDETRLAARIREFKPRITHEDALQALRFVSSLEEEVRGQGQAAHKRFEAAKATA